MRTNLFKFILLAGIVTSVMLFAGEQEAEAYRPGQKVMVHWKTKWYPATVLTARPGSWYIRYDGYSSKWNEWVGARRIRARNVRGGFMVGSRVWVHWKTKWYKAVVLRSRPGTWYIRYVGYGAKWNEWVGRSRIKWRR